MAANENDSKIMDCIYQWQFVNVSHSWWMKKKEHIKSPTFILDGPVKTKWSLLLYPMGKYGECIDVYLYREMDCIGPDSVEVEYKLEFLGKDDAITEDEMNEESFKKGEDSASLDSKDLETVYITEREIYLPGDALTVRCHLRNLQKDGVGEGLVKPQHLYARTVLNASRKSFHWIIGKFSTVPPGVIKKYQDHLITISLILNKNSSKNLSVNISYLNVVKYIWGKISITDSEGNKESCGIFTRNDSTENILSDIPTEFIENKTRYLPNDELSLDFDIVLSTIEHSTTCSTKNPPEQEKHGNVTFLVDDLKLMYNDQIFSDVKLRTSTKNFPAHKNILSARSAVFRKMFSCDMKEKNSGRVDIDDLEDDTVHRMLLFLYTGFLGTLNFESAYKLYKAADKYEIQSLKRVCSSLLKDILHPTTACKVLLLADLHQDVDLRKSVLDYLIKHGEVFQSLEWEHFMDTNLKLAADIMCKIINLAFVS